MANGSWNIESMSMVSGGIPVVPGMDVGVTSLKMTVSDPAGNKRDILRGGATVSATFAPKSVQTLQETLMKKMSLAGKEGKGHLVANTVKALLGNVNTGTMGDLLSYYDVTPSLTKGIIKPNQVRVNLEILQQLVPPTTIGLIVAAAMLTKGRPSPPLTWQNLTEDHMQSIILAGAIGPGAAEAGIFYFGLPKIAVGMPWAPFFASGFAGYGYGGLTLKFPSAQLGITFWGAGEQVIN